MVEGMEDMVRVVVVNRTAGGLMGNVVLRRDVVNVSLEIVLVFSDGILDLRMRNDIEMHAMEGGGGKHWITEQVLVSTLDSRKGYQS